MAELTPIPSAQRPSDPGYQPVSGYAVAAALTAGVFGLFLLGLVVSAINSGRSPYSYELLAVPVVGFVLAAIARSHIRNSEGTRTGMRLATISWWVCVLGGAGFFGFMYANEMVLEKESARYAERFFDELKAGRITHAFDYLLAPEDRGRADPDVPEAFEMAYLAAGYPAYKNHEVVRLIVRNGSAVELERTGVKDLTQESSGFQATHLYRLTCPEGVFEVQVRLTAPESKRARRPEWFIANQPAPNISVRVLQMHRYGRITAELEQEGDGAAKLWMLHLTNNRLALAHIMTTPRGHREPLETAAFNVRFLGGGPSVHFPLSGRLLPPDRAAGRPTDPPPTLLAQARLAFDDLNDIGFFRKDASGTAIPSDRLAKLRELWSPPRLSSSSVPRQVGMAQVPPEVPTITLGPDAITVSTPAELALDTQQFVRCTIGVTCTNPELLAAIAEARKSGAPDDGEGVLKTLPARDWRIAWLRTDMEPHSVVTGPGQVSRTRTPGD